MWSRWTREYVRTLREQHHLTGEKKRKQPSPGEVVVIKEDQKPRNTWKLAVVKRVITGRDGIVRAAQLKTTNGYLERAIQHLFPLELNCNVTQTSQLSNLTQLPRSMTETQRRCSSCSINESKGNIRAREERTLTRDK